MIEESITNKIKSFPRLTNKDTKLLCELSDILAEVQFLKGNPTYEHLLSYFDRSSGIKPILQKLPIGLQEKWITRAANYITKYGVTHPPFSEFRKFIAEMSRTKNNPGLNYDSPVKIVGSDHISKQHFPIKAKVSVRMTNTKQTTENRKTVDPRRYCILHKSKHTLNECRKFRGKSIEYRKKILTENNIYFKCCQSNTHMSPDCTGADLCIDCNSKYHPTGLHINQNSQRAGPPGKTTPQQGGETGSPAKTETEQKVTSTCTEIYGNPQN